MSDLSPLSQEKRPAQGLNFYIIKLKRIKALLLLLIGFLLSPLSWWNDLFFNLPLAYGFGYLCTGLSSDWFLPGAIAGYWCSNVLGILLMQMGMIDVFQEDKEKFNFRKTLLTGLASSTAYTGIILVLIHFQILDTPDLSVAQSSLNLGSILPNFRH